MSYSVVEVMGNWLIQDKDTVPYEAGLLKEQHYSA